MKVCKFGGSSVAGPEQVRAICDIVLKDPERRIVVVSAPGKRHDGDTKVTDLLIACAEARLSGADTAAPLAAVVERYAEIQAGLGLPVGLTEQIAVDLKRRLDGDTSHRDRFIDQMKAAGEDECAKLVAAELDHRGAQARYVNPGDAGLLLSDEYGNAQLLPESYENLSKLGDTDGVVVFPGFFGMTPEGEVVTFPRGGSDITGSILAAAVGADIYENFTDVDSVYAVDPRLVERAQPISEMTYREMRELSYAGFSVLHDEAILPAVHAGIPICIKNTHRPSAPGTRINPERAPDEPRIVGVAGSDGFCTVFVSKYLMNREIGFGRRLLQIFEEEAVSFEHAPSSMDSMSVILAEDSLDEKTEQRIMERISDELGADSVEVERGLALIMLVGEGMRDTVGVAAQATAALAQAGVSIEMINQGASEISIMFGVKAEYRESAIRAMHDAFFTNAVA